MPSNHVTDNAGIMAYIAVTQPQYNDIVHASLYIKRDQFKRTIVSIQTNSLLTNDINLKAIVLKTLLIATLQVRFRFIYDS